MPKRFVIVIIAGALCAAALALSVGRWSGPPPEASLPTRVVSLEAGHARAGGATVAVTVANAQLKDFPIVLSTFGNVQAPDTVAIGARTASQITAIHVKDGQMVKAGDPLFTLDDRAAKAQLARDRAVLVKDTALLADATAELERARTLRDDKNGTQQAYDTAQSVQQSAQATVDADNATIDADLVALSLLQINAPIDGRLGAVQVTVGDLVGTSTNTQNTLVTITAINPIDVVFRVPEDRLQTFKTLLDTGKPPRVKAKTNNTDTVIAEGVVDFIDSAVDATSGTIAMRASFANDEQKLWPGQYVDVDVEQGTLAQTPVIPAVAIQTGQNGPFVYKVKADSSVEVRPIVVAANDGTDAAVNSGLAAGDRVVTEGQSRLKAGDLVSIAPDAGTSPTNGLALP
ncbi:efflux RND transporter periplasmic adaptor subunit [Ensifer sp.]|uniref:efflux RND transporter periplasmic adaptor subunit n=1 Tax=Ensifer sp. TaxID=1872086 RepID=UPI002897A561|nr:efflux RND transporter periplasmic adaptor subunit [Ensifer sp.]